MYKSYSVSSKVCKNAKVRYKITNIIQNKRCCKKNIVGSRMLEWLVTIGDARKSAGRLEWTFDDFCGQNSLQALLAVGSYSSVPN